MLRLYFVLNGKEMEDVEALRQSMAVTPFSWANSSLMSHKGGRGSFHRYASFVFSVDR